MKPEELMVDDWFLMYKKQKQVLSISELNAISILVEAGEIIKPIPITFEILEKNGFKDLWSTKRLVLEIKDYTVAYNLEDCSVGIFSLYQSIISVHDIKYIHELQHTLRLCKIDKKIVL